MEYPSFHSVLEDTEEFRAFSEFLGTKTDSHDCLYCNSKSFAAEKFIFLEIYKQIHMFQESSESQKARSEKAHKIVNMLTQAQTIGLPQVRQALA